jgi:hypothetical protein
MCSLAGQWHWIRVEMNRRHEDRQIKERTYRAEEGFWKGQGRGWGRCALSPVTLLGVELHPSNRELMDGFMLWPNIIGFHVENDPIAMWR